MKIYLLIDEGTSKMIKLGKRKTAENDTYKLWGKVVSRGEKNARIRKLN